MKFVIAKEHRDFFHEHGFIQFDDLIKENELVEIQEILKNKLLKMRPNEAFHLGRDLWRKEETFRKLVMRKRFAEIASSLMNESYFRLAYDQLLVSSSNIYRLRPEEDPYTHWLEKDKTLNEISSFQGIKCGLMISLDSQDEGIKNSLFFFAEGLRGLFLTRSIDSLISAHRTSKDVLFTHCVCGK